MTPRRAPRRRTVAKWALGATLVLSSLLASAELPEAPAGLAGNSRAAAQVSGLVPGTPRSCPASPAGWEVDINDEQLCRILVDACPFSPYDEKSLPTELMQPDDEYPEFCREAAVASGHERYERCLSLIREAYVVVDDAVGCTVRQFRSCTVGTRLGPSVCRATARRTWTCEQGIPRNEFNTCYVAPSTPISPLPVCASGAPSFVALDCETYVGSDFVTDRNGDECADEFGMRDNTANRYWCVYDQKDLDPQCHNASPPCNPGHDALCLKRQSRTGGCRATAKAIECTQQREDFRSEAESLPENPTRTQSEELASHAAAARAAGCEPCLILVFTPVPEHCPAEYTEDPVYKVGYHDALRQPHEAALTHRTHFRQSSNSCANSPLILTDTCRNLDPLCEAPTPGHPVWSSAHFSEVAVVNSATVVRLNDVPTKFRHGSTPGRFNILADDLRTPDDWKDFINKSYAFYPTTGQQDEFLLRTQTRAAGYARIRVDSVWRHGNLAHECIVLGLPAFRLFVAELWPDDGPDYRTDDDGHCVVSPGDERPLSNAETIRQLFGPHSLDWWCRLTPGERRSRTLSRGLRFLPDLADTDRDAEIEARADALTGAVDCNIELETQVWCTWTPSRSGYYQLTVGGAWMMSIRWSRAWRTEAELSALQTTVMGLQDSDRQRIRRLLGQIGCGQGRPVEDSCRWPPGVIGLTDDMTDIRPTGPGGTWDERDSDWLWQLAGDGHRFGGWDLRVTFTDGPNTTLYTETEDFGVQVHEVRVSTVTPSR